MENHRPIALDLPEDLILALARSARKAGRTPSDFARDALAAACSIEVTAPLSRQDRGVVAHALDRADGWFDLQTRLRASGFILRPGEASTLALHSWPLERRLLPVEALGHSLTSLTLRFRAPFPGLLPGTRLSFTVDAPKDQPVRAA